MKSLLFWAVFFANFIFPSDQYDTEMLQRILSRMPEKKLMTVLVQPFSRIFASVGTVRLDPMRSGDSVLVEGKENIIDSLTVATYNKTLYIGPKDPSNTIISDNLTISVGINSYLNLSLVGRALYRFSSTLQADKFSLELSGQAACDMYCDVKELEVKMSGSSTLSCTGNAESYQVLMFDNAKMDNTKLQGTLTHLIKRGKAEFEDFAKSH
jgi:hypothetical protein